MGSGGAWRKELRKGEGEWREGRDTAAFRMNGNGKDKYLMWISLVTCYPFGGAEFCGGRRT